VHHLGAFAESAVCAFHFWEDFQGRSKIGFPVFLFLKRSPAFCGVLEGCCTALRARSIVLTPNFLCCACYETFREH
jgi:hypothetical protein